jgi:hypothetical protein
MLRFYPRSGPSNCDRLEWWSGLVKAAADAGPFALPFQPAEHTTCVQKPWIALGSIVAGSFRSGKLSGMYKEGQCSPTDSAVFAKPVLLAFGEGFYPDEGDWRWMGPEAEVIVRREALPACLCIELTCGRPKTTAG